METINHERFKDFARVDLISGARNEYAPPARNDPGFIRFGWGNRGALGSVPWIDFYNGWFKITAAMEPRSNTHHYYSDGAIRQGLTYVQEPGVTIQATGALGAAPVVP